MKLARPHGLASDTIHMTRNIIAIVDDLFFASKIRGTAEQVGVRVIFVKSISDVIEKVREDTPALIIADLNARCDAIELARALKTDENLNEIPILGFFSHVETELQQAALSAGFDRVVPRSAFTKNLPEILEAGLSQD